MLSHGVPCHTMSCHAMPCNATCLLHVNDENDDKEEAGDDVRAESDHDDDGI